MPLEAALSNALRRATESTYDVTRSYTENYANGPVFGGALPDIQFPQSQVTLEKAARYRFLERAVNTPLGVPAGPLLNAAYIKLYADLGFDILTYKTVRSVARPSHPTPNVVYIEADPQQFSASTGGGGDRPALFARRDQTIVPPLDQLSITNSFGMPSQPLETWQPDVARAKEALHPGQMLVVSVVGTTPPDQDTLPALAADYAHTARLAFAAGADAVEANLSCPNVGGSEGSLFRDPHAVHAISAALRDAAGAHGKFMLKLGYMSDEGLLGDVAGAAFDAGADGLAAINTIPARVYLPDTQAAALPGDGRLVSGICGAAIKPAALLTARRLVGLRDRLLATASPERRAQGFAIVGVGGVMTAADALEYIEIGVDSVQSGTGAMWNSHMAEDLRRLLGL